MKRARAQGLVLGSTVEHAWTCASELDQRPECRPRHARHQVRRTQGGCQNTRFTGHRGCAVKIFMLSGSRTGGQLPVLEESGCCLPENGSVLAVACLPPQCAAASLQT